METRKVEIDILNEPEIGELLAAGRLSIVARTYLAQIWALDAVEAAQEARLMAEVLAARAMRLDPVRTSASVPH